MGVATGFKTRLALGKETSFGTAVVPSVMLPFTSESLTVDKELLEDAILAGRAGRNLAETSKINVSGSVEADLTYTDFDLLLELAFGSMVDDGFGTKTFDLATDLDVSGTVVVDKSVSIHEFAGMKVNTLSIKSDGQKLTISADFIGKSYTRNGTVTAADIDAVDTGFGARILHSDLTFKVAGAAFGISSFEFQLNNNLTAIFENNKLCEAIERNAKREVSFSFELPRYTADTFNTYFDADTEVDIEVTATNGTQTFQLLLPKVLVKPSQNVGGQDIVKQSIECTVLRGQGTVSEEARIVITG